MVLLVPCHPSRAVNLGRRRRRPGSAPPSEAAASSGPANAFGSASSAWATAATRCSTPSWSTRTAEVVAICDLYQPYLDFAAKKIGGQPEAVQGLPQAARHARTSTRSSSPRPTTGTRCRSIHACQAGKDVYVEKPLSLVRRRGPRDGGGGPATPSASCRSACSAARRPSARRRRSSSAAAAIGKVTVVRGFHIQNEWPKGIGNPPDEAAAGGLRLGRLARPGAEGALQPQPHLLPLPLVLRLLRRAAHQLRRPLPRHDPLGARARRPAGRHRHGRQVRDRGQPRGARHARGRCGTTPATRW